MPHIAELVITVRSTEIDVNGHVNNAKYLEYLEWGREEWFDTCGLHYQTLQNLNIMTVVVHVSANYRKEVVQGEQLLIVTWIKSVGNTSMTMAQKIYNAAKTIVLDAEFTIVTVNVTHNEKTRVPDEIRRKFNND